MTPDHKALVERLEEQAEALSAHNHYSSFGYYDKQASTAIKELQEEIEALSKRNELAEQVVDGLEATNQILWNILNALERGNFLVEAPTQAEDEVAERVRTFIRQALKGQSHD